MEQSLLIQYLYSLSLDECQQFGLYLHSPYFNRKKLPIRLFEFLLPFHMQWQSDKLETPISREAAFAAVYPGKPFVAQRLRRIRMELTQLLLDFIGLHSKQVFPADFRREYALRKHLLDRGRLDLYADRQQQTKDNASTNNFEPNQHLQAMFLELLHNEYLIHAGKPEDSLETTAALLDRHFLGTRLALWTSMINKERIYNQPHHYTFIEVISAMIGSEVAQSWDNVQLWWQVFQLHQPTTGESAFQYLQGFLSRKAEILPIGQLRQIRGFMLNYINRSTESADKYVLAWQLLKTMLAEGTLYAQGKINSPLFRNTVRAACLSGNVTWAKTFVETHGPDLKGEESPAQLELFRALVAFFAGRPRKALARTMTLKFKSLRNEVYLKVLQIMCTYEFGEADAFFRRVEAFRKYVAHTEKLGDKFADRYHAFARMVLRLGKAKFSLQRPRPGFAEEVAEARVAEKLWLMRAIEDLRP